MERRNLITGGLVLAGGVAVGALPAAARENPMPEALRNALERESNAPVLGNGSGNITMTEFFDYNCPHCRASVKSVHALISQDKSLRVIFREWPVFGEGSEFSAKASLAVAAGPRENAAALAFDTITDPEQLQQALGASAQPSMIYVTADWCVTCRGIERSVLPHPAVAAALQDMRLLKADVTTLDDQRQALMRQMGAAGPPTMIFLDADGHEIEGSRLIGRVDPAQLILAATRLKGGG
nr:DsbA family protein [Paracoccus ravus]